MKKTNFDIFLAEELRDPKFAKRFKTAGEAWDVALEKAARPKVRSDSKPKQFQSSTCELRGGRKK